MKYLVSIIDCLKKLHVISNSVEEKWAYVSFSGATAKNEASSVILAESVTEFESILEEIDCVVAIALTIDNENVSIEDFIEYAAKPLTYSFWKITIRKNILTEKKIDSNFNYNFFFSEECCNEWLNHIHPINEENPINQLAPLKIVIGDLVMSFGGKYLYFLPADIAYESRVYTNPVILPDSIKINENVHFIANFKVKFDPNIYVITEGDFSSILSNNLLGKSSIVLASCIVNEFYDLGRIVIDGLKRLSLKLVDVTDRFTYSDNQQLVKLVAWMYEDRISTRRKLFTERLTLEMNDTDSLIKSLTLHLEDSLQQAKARFDFVILERKDAYMKELKDLLKDLRAQSDLYSLKIRTLLNNFLRDILAAVVLIGFTIFTKFTDNIGLVKNALLDYVFYGLGIYYIVSFIFQLAVDITDVKITDKELRYWKKASKEMLSESEFDTHFNTSLKDRSLSLYILYSLIGLLYIAVAIACFCYPTFFKSLIIS